MSGDAEYTNEQQVVEHFQKLQSEYNSIANTISELELEKRDHEYAEKNILFTK
jgi:hypothetical protein